MFIRIWTYAMSAIVVAIFVTVSSGCDEVRQIGDDFIAIGEDAINCEESGKVYVWGECREKDVAPAVDDSPEVTPKDSSPCVPGHPKAKRTVLYCGGDSVYVLPKGDYDVRRGRFTAKITGIGDSPTPVAAGLFVLHGKDFRGNEQNVHGLYIDDGRGIRLTHSRWAAGGHTEDHGGWQPGSRRSGFSLSPSSVYTFDCDWNEVRMVCNIFEGDTRIQRHEIRIRLAFASLMHGGTFGFRFGQKAVRWTNIGNNPKVTGVRFSTH